MVASIQFFNNIIRPKSLEAFYFCGYISNHTNQVNALWWSLSEHDLETLFLLLKLFKSKRENGLSTADAALGIGADTIFLQPLSAT